MPKMYIDISADTRRYLEWLKNGKKKTPMSATIDEAVEIMAAKDENYQEHLRQQIIKLKESVI